jgi:hypothetical protein
MIEYNVGDKLTCISSKSNGYTVGRVYRVTVRDGTKGLIGNDKLFDPLSKLVSKFTKTETKSDDTPVDKDHSEL